MGGSVEQLVGAAILHRAAGVHDQYVVGDLGNDAEVVGDQHDGVELALQIADQVEDLRLDCDVESGGRFVGDEQSGSHDRAMAIMARCRIPPENWCG